MSRRRLVGLGRPRWRFDRLPEPLVRPLAEGLLVGPRVLAALGVAEEIAELVLDVAPGPADCDPLLFPPPGTRGRIHLVAEIEDNAPAALVSVGRGSLSSRFSFGRLAGVDGGDHRPRPSYVDWIFVLSRSRSDRKSTRLNSSHGYISYAVFCLKKKKK